MAVNVGYSIGWGYPLDPDLTSEWFSTFFVFIGAGMGTYTLGCFLVICTKTSRQWEVANEETKYNTNTYPTATTTNRINNRCILLNIIYIYVRDMINFGRSHLLRLFSMFFFILWLFMMQM